MVDRGKHNILGVLVDTVDYAAATERILLAARDRQGFAATALAVHGLVLGHRDRVQRYRLNHFDLVTPDGQPVRWMLNLKYGARLQDRVYGPALMLRLCKAAAQERLPVYFYGSSGAVVERLAKNLKTRIPELIVAGFEPSRFRRLTPGEKEDLCARVKQSGARLLFVGLGCPRQEIFAFEFREDMAMPVVAVGAAFDYHSGFLREPPATMQRLGLQWLHRLLQEPGRLWRRYFEMNSAFLVAVCLQMLGWAKPNPLDTEAPCGDILHG